MGEGKKKVVFMLCPEITGETEFYNFVQALGKSLEGTSFDKEFKIIATNWTRDQFKTVDEAVEALKELIKVLKSKP